MCRWIIYLGKQKMLLEDLLIKPDHSIVKQVSQRFLPGLKHGLEEDPDGEFEKQATQINVDGFGLSWYTDALKEFDPSITELQPTLFRTVAPIATNLAFLQLCGHVASTCILAHIRDASFPPVVEVNNHPFVFGKYVFMHNGSVDSFRRYDVVTRIADLQAEVQKLGCRSSVPGSNYISNIQGNTDTEHLANLYFAHLDLIRFVGQESSDDSTDELLLALVKTISDIHAIQLKYQVGPFTPGAGKERVGNALNLCITDGGVEMVVTRWRDSREGYPRSLYLSFTAGEKVNRKYYPVVPDPPPSEDINSSDVEILSVKELVARYVEPTKQGRHVIVGSEPSTRYVQDWGLFDQNQCVTVNKKGQLRMINMPKFFQPGREHEFEKYGFTEILTKLARLEHSNTGVTCGVPLLHAIKFPKDKSSAFETALDLGVPKK